jgi:hypothetical protein
MKASAMGNVCSTHETECKRVLVENRDGNRLEDLRTGERIIFKSTLKKHNAKLESRITRLNIQTKMNFRVSIN